ncbi:MAG TPA: flagellar protein FlaG [Methyloversatilis sp.]
MAVQPVSHTPPALTPAVNATSGVKPVVEQKNAAEPASTTPLTSDQIEKTVDEIRRHIEPVAQNLLFTIDKDTGKTIVRLIDSSTKEVLRQIPSEELIAIARALGKGQSGLIERKA